MARRALKKLSVVGVDEVGRGPLAGPVTVGAVAGLSNKELRGIRDSKKLTPKAREKWFSYIKKNGYVSVVSIAPEYIDKHGIVRAANAAVAIALKKIPATPKKVYLDGGLKAPDKFPQESIIKGDEKMPLIAAASIMAKVTRDKYMVGMSEKYPEYNFARHKGYGTKIHMDAIKKTGLSPIHRKTFCRKLAQK